MVALTHSLTHSLTVQAEAHSARADAAIAAGMGRPASLLSSPGPMSMGHPGMMMNPPLGQPPVGQSTKPASSTPGASTPGQQ